MESRIITTEARRTPREESPNPQRLSVEKNRRCLTESVWKTPQAERVTRDEVSGVRTPSPHALPGRQYKSFLFHHPSSIINLPPSIITFYFLHLYLFNDNSVAMLKKLLVSLLSAFLCISVVAEPESQSNENQNVNDAKIDEKGNVFVAPLKYHISSDSTAEVIKDDSYKKLESVVIPSEIQVDGHVYSVTSIGESAFSWCSGLKNIEIPSSVTSIGDKAFFVCDGLIGTYRICCGWRSIKIPSSVTSIGNEAFGYIAVV